LSCPFRHDHLDMTKIKKNKHSIAKNLFNGNLTATQVLRKDFLEVKSKIESKGVFIALMCSQHEGESSKFLLQKIARYETIWRGKTAPTPDELVYIKTALLTPTLQPAQLVEAAGEELVVKTEAQLRAEYRAERVAEVAGSKGRVAGYMKRSKIETR
jgi:hypothetical protein